ncbi:AAA domain-containing protein [Anoxybacillus vitaminiphilus]|uniref:AAA domain-containing protein n=1 Tax=Paranoxybacillus vitaminiphilus TaxID=581036 RepID=A0A327Y568_9BACL|nr:AAA family ATPase [Anoxybacillus vitaminiphilus]RAK15432.1 AAA domain-containing protein [Anoxybacillus vitaminiphilus]
MANSYAKFYKCALQVNPYDYIKYRGQKHSLSEEEYNHAIYENCLQAGIKVVGLANHGDVQKSKSLREYLQEKGIVVFPGFEISTSEKVHIVCLFDENTNEIQLERYLGSLEIIDTNDGISPSKLSFSQIAQKIEELNGFWYAAHVTQDNGVLKLQQYPIWQSSLLKAAQIPAKRDEVEEKYINILKNKDPNYKKDTPFALINAKDVSKPEDILSETASCLVKMSEPNFSCFKLAFKDPDARVRLNSDLNKIHHSSIDQINIFGGYLDDFEINLSPNLNTIIGGRGTGKSTLIELIRYALEQEPKGKDAKKTFKNIVDANLGAGGRVELIVTSHKQFGKQFKIIKRFDSPAVIMNMDGTKSKLKIEDILPSIEIYSQNEIVEITEDEDAKLQILNRFLDYDNNIVQSKEEKKNSLRKNATLLLEKYERFDELSSKINKLPSLKEKQKNFEELGISQKLQVQGDITTEEGYISAAKENINNHSFQIKNVAVPFSDDFINKTKNSSIFKELKQEIDNFNERLKHFNAQYEDLKISTLHSIQSISNKWSVEKQKVEDQIKKAIKSLGELNGINGEDIAKEYSNTLKEIATIEPLEQELSQLKKEIEKLEEERSNLLEQLNAILDNELDTLRKVVKKINKKKLKGKVKIEIYPKRNRELLIDFLAQEKGLGTQGLKWLNEIDNFDISSFIEHIKNGKDAVYNAYKSYGLQHSKAEILAGMSKERLLELEIIDLPNIIDIQLNVSSNEKENYKSLNKLSKGQQCTAILNILMLDNNDPLIVDQPEDNLDNSYIANNLVEGLRELKINRQFIFATHNANIPVFGDAELIGVMEENEGTGSINKNCLGSVDNNSVKEAVVNTLEGGSLAFRMRKEKYNI